MNQSQSRFSPQSSACSSTRESSGGGFAKIVPLFFFLFFPCFFSGSLFYCVWGGGVVCFGVLFFSWRGEGGVVVLPGWLTIIALFYIAKVKPSPGFQTLMLTFTIK